MRNTASEGCALIIVFAVICAPMFVFKAYLANFTDETVRATVIENDRIAAGESSRYLVFTENEVFENDDSLWYWKWDSSDMQGFIRPGKTYDFKVYGWRWPIFSMYRNIVSATEVKP